MWKFVNVLKILKFLKSIKQFYSFTSVDQLSFCYNYLIIINDYQL